MPADGGRQGERSRAGRLGEERGLEGVDAPERRFELRIGGAGLVVGRGWPAPVGGGAEVGERARVAAGSVGREQSQMPAEVLAAGVPAEIKGALPPRVQARMAKGPVHYQEMARLYTDGTNVIG